MVWSELHDHLEVLWGALAALAIVLVLTPAVGRRARSLASSTGRRKGACPRDPAARRARDVPRRPRAVARVPAARRRAARRAARRGVATTIGAIDDFRGSELVAEARRPGARCRDPDWFGVSVHAVHLPVIGVHDAAGLGRRADHGARIVAVMNMVNFLDGLDGLAAGVCAISGFTFAVIELSLGRIGVAVLAAIVCGACLGFLRHNFYPARIFMGDSGALLLGYTLATIAVEGLLKTAALATLVLPLLVLAVPVIDTSFVVAKRLRSGQPIYVADARHLHHRFMRIGFSRAPRGHLPLDVVRHARARRAGDAVRAAASPWPLERRQRRGRRRGRAGSDRVLALRGLSARDREAREPRGAGAARPSATPPDRRHKRQRSAAPLEGIGCHKRWYAPQRCSPSDRRSPSQGPAACSSDPRQRASSSAR